MLNSNFLQTLSGAKAAIIYISKVKGTDELEELAIKSAKDSFSLLNVEVLRVHSLFNNQHTLKECIEDILADNRANLIVTIGGTGVSETDETPNTIVKISDKVYPGIGELLRNVWSKDSPAAWANRAVGGSIDGVLLVTLPRVPKAIHDGLIALDNVGGYILQELNS